MMISCLVFVFTTPEFQHSPYAYIFIFHNFVLTEELMTSFSSLLKYIDHTSAILSKCQAVTTRHNEGTQPIVCLDTITWTEYGTNAADASSGVSRRRSKDV